MRVRPQRVSRRCSLLLLAVAATALLSAPALAKGHKDEHKSVSALLDWVEQCGCTD